MAHLRSPAELKPGASSITAAEIRGALKSTSEYQNALKKVLRDTLMGKDKDGFPLRQDSSSSQQEDNSLRASIRKALNNPLSSRFAQFFAGFSNTVILLSIMTFCFETVPTLENDTSEQVFAVAEVVFNVLFTLEVAVRWAVFEERRKFLLDPMNVIDVLAIAPFYARLVITATMELSAEQLRTMVVLRLFRLVRILKLNRSMEAALVFTQVLVRSRHALAMFALSMLCSIVVFSGVLHYSYVGIEADPMAPAGCGPENDVACFSSIPKAMWWTLQTITSVGFGDAVPRTSRHWLAFVVPPVGLVTMSMPIALISRQYMIVDAEIQSKRQMLEEELRLRRQNRPSGVGVFTALFRAKHWVRVWKKRRENQARMRTGSVIMSSVATMSSWVRRAVRRQRALHARVKRPWLRRIGSERNPTNQAGAKPLARGHLTLQERQAEMKSLREAIESACCRLQEAQSQAKQELCEISKTIRVTSNPSRVVQPRKLHRAYRSSFHGRGIRRPGETLGFKSSKYSGVSEIRSMKPALLVEDIQKFQVLQKVEEARDLFDFIEQREKKLVEKLTVLEEFCVTTLTAVGARMGVPAAQLASMLNHQATVQSSQGALFDLAVSEDESDDEHEELYQTAQSLPARSRRASM